MQVFSIVKLAFSIKFTLIIGHHALTVKKCTANAVTILIELQYLNCKLENNNKFQLQPPQVEKGEMRELVITRIVFHSRCCTRCTFISTQCKENGTRSKKKIRALIQTDI